MRKKIKNKLLFITAVTFILAMLSVGTAFAETFNLAYSLTEGGYRLELNTATPYKGVKLEVSSDVATRYEIIQRIITPLENRDKPGFAVRDNLVFRALRGSNQFGDLRARSDDSPVALDEVVYVSDVAGNADSFTLVFGIRDIESLDPGDYFGRIGFTLSPIGGTRGPVTKILDVYLSVDRESQGKPRIEISTSTGQGIILLNPKREGMQSADVLIRINRKSRMPFSIVQYLAQVPESEEGNRLQEDQASFIVKEAKKGVAINRVTSLSVGPQSIYTSLPSGEADDYFVITYALGDLLKQMAGTYRSRLQYFLDEAGTQTKLETIELQVENERVFDFMVTPGDQKYGIEFSDVKPTEPPRRSEIVIQTLTNIGKRYQVSQDVYSDLTNKEGQIVPSKYFTLRTESLDSVGKLNVLNKQEVRKGSAVLYISDNRGSADKFKLIYELECPKDLNAGDYSTRIVYSLLEI